MKKAAVIIIGNEILLGRVTDTNSGFIARTLDPYGISVDTIVTVGDDGAAIADAVRRLTATYPLVLTRISRASTTASADLRHRSYTPCATG